MIDTLDVLDLVLAAAILVLAYTVRGITGFGSGLISIPLLALFLPLQVVVPMIGLLDYLASLGHGVSNRRQIRWREILPLLPFTFAGVLLALYIFKTVDAQLLVKVLGAFILAYAVYSLFGREPHTGRTRFWALPAGSMGGFVGTLFGTGGPFYVMYLHARGLDKAAFRASIALIFLIDGGSRQLGYLASGFYNFEMLLLVVMALPIMMVAMYAGGHIHTRITPQQFRRGIAVILLGSGIALLLR